MILQYIAILKLKSPYIHKCTYGYELPYKHTSPSVSGRRGVQPHLEAMLQKIVTWLQ
jgi:hypothetical protein